MLGSTKSFGNDICEDAAVDDISFWVVLPSYTQIYLLSLY